MTDHYQAAVEAAEDAMRSKGRLAEIAVEAAEPHLRRKWAEELVERIGASNLGAAPGEDEGAVQEFLVFVHTSMDVVRIECTALHTPGEWPRVAEFRVESRNDDGGTEIERWSVQKARV